MHVSYTVCARCAWLECLSLFVFCLSRLRRSRARPQKASMALENLQDRARKIHEEAPKQNFAVPSFTDSATRRAQTMKT